VGLLLQALKTNKMNKKRRELGKKAVWSIEVFISVKKYQRGTGDFGVFPLINAFAQPRKAAFGL
jgi:hypothetical protein